MERSLKELLELFESSLVGRLFTVVLEDRPAVSFRFQKSQFVHLAGIHHIVAGSFNARRNRGLLGAEAIATGELTRDRLASLNGSQYARYKARIDGIEFLCQGFFTSKGLRLFEFDPEKRKASASTLPKGLAFVSPEGKVLFFLEITKDGSSYEPRTFFPCRLSYLAGQTEIKRFKLYSLNLDL